MDAAATRVRTLAPPSTTRVMAEAVVAPLATTPGPDHIAVSPSDEKATLPQVASRFLADGLFRHLGSARRHGPPGVPPSILELIELRGQQGHHHRVVPVVGRHEPHEVALIESLALCTRG